MPMPITVGSASSGGVPVGAYTGTFTGIEVVPATNEMSEGLRWRWTIDAGEHQGKSTQRITSKTARPTTNCGRMLGALVGHAVTEGEVVDPEQYLGRRYTLVVSATTNGGTRVETCVPFN